VRGAWGRWRGRGALELRRETFDNEDRWKPTNSIGSKRLDNLGLEGSLKRESRYAVWGWSLAGEARGDWPHDDLRRSPEFSGRLAGTLMWSALIPLELELSAGHSYTLPSFYDLYWKGDSQASGNPDLLPERSDGAQARLSAKGASWRCEVSGSRREYEDLIHWRQSAQGWKPINLDAAEKRVFETSGMWRPLPFIELDASWMRIFAWDRSLNDDGSHGDHWGCNLTNTPSSQTRLALAITPGRWRLEAEWTRTGRRWTTVDNLTGTMPSFELVNSGLAWSPKVWGICWRLELRADNLLDKRYYLYTSEPMPGRGWSAGVSASTTL